ncbi:MAG: ADP-forming succinate--CoA ligase subunit beta [Desulfurococcales archaeon]|jgi:succinyl-CoA synthetase beta subunit|nr:ADP-forming succinate--CoA ligase subunit beta [Desulfurococcales archaeon]
MRLYEFEGKEIFSRYGIRIPRGVVISSPEEISEAIKKIGLPAILKAQVLVGGRGKAGGIRIANSADEASGIAREMLSSEIRGVRVRRLLVEEAVKIAREIYLSITIDRGARKYVILGSLEGGIDIEEIAARKPESIVRIYIDPLIGLRNYHVRALSNSMGFSGELASKLGSIVIGLYRIMIDYDADLVEINPLALTENHDLVALDAKITIDDNALYRHPDLASLLEKDPRDMDEDEVVARKHGFSYVKLDGDIGIMGNGAGLTMASMDLVKLYGGKPASFLDIGGGASRERVKAALGILLKRRDIKSIFINIYGGITRCDEVAMGIVEAMKEAGSDKKIFVRLVGTREEEGRKILVENGIKYFTDDSEAAIEAVRASSR